MAKRFSELAAAAAVGLSDILAVVGGGVSLKATVAQVRDAVFSQTLGIPFETYGGSTSNTGAQNAAAMAAFVTAATTAAAAGAPIRLVLSGHYTITGSYTLPSCSIVGTGTATSGFIISDNAVFLQVNSNDTYLGHFRIKGPNTGALSLLAVQCGVSGGAACPDKNVVIERVYFKQCAGGIRCVNGSGSNHRGVKIWNCEFEIQANVLADIANFAIDVKEQAEYVQIESPVIYPSTAASNYGHGIRIAAGSCYVSDVGISDINRAFVLLPGTNTLHSTCVGGYINHCAAPFDATGATSAGGGPFGFIFHDVNMFGGQRLFADGDDIIIVGGSHSFDSGGAQQILVTSGQGNMFLDCEFVNAPTIDAGAGQVFFRRVRLRNSLASMPSTVAGHVQRSFAFAADADQTLTLQEITAETIIVAAGTTTAARALTAPAGYTAAVAKGMQIRFINNNAQTVSFQWTSGTSVAIGTGARVMVGSDGTNAIFVYI